MSKRRQQSPGQDTSQASTAAPRTSNDRGPLIGIAWVGVIFYLAAFFWTALPIVVPDSITVIRRIDVLGTVFVGEQTVAYWFEGFSPTSLLQRGQILASAAGIFLVACAAGWMCLRWTGIDRMLTRLERFVFAAGVGSNVVSLATLGLGLVGAMNRWVFAGAGGLVVGGAIFTALRSKSPSAEPLAEPVVAPTSRLQSRASIFSDPRWLWAGMPFVVVLVLGAMLPPIDFDVREYHLQAPKEFYQNGRIAFLPHNIYANMPLGTEMLSLAGMIVCDDWWFGALVGKTLIALFAPLAALALLAAGWRFVSPAAGVIAALVYISIPWIDLVSTHGLVEGAFAFYLFAALLAVILWQSSEDALRERLLWLAGFLSGAAVSTKYPAVLFSVLPLAAMVVYTVLDPQRDKASQQATTHPLIRPVGVFLLAIVVGCGLWLEKNFLQTGNPVYPLLVSVFGGATRTPENDAQWTRVHDPPNSQLADLAKRTGEVTLTSPWLSPLLMPLAALALVGPRRRIAWWLAAYFAFVFLGWWFFTHRIDRFWVPVLPIVALLAGMGATWTDARAWRAPVVALLLFGLLSNFVLLTSGTLGDNRYFADLNLLRTDAERVDPWHLVLNARGDKVTKVLMVGDAEPYDLEVPVLYNTVFDDDLFETIARGHSPEEVRQALAEQNISHIYVNWSEVARYRSPGNYGITKFIDPSVFASLVEAGVLVLEPPIEDNPNELYRVLPASPDRANDGESR